MTNGLTEKKSRPTGVTVQVIDLTPLLERAVGLFSVTMSNDKVTLVDFKTRASRWAIAPSARNEDTTVLLNTEGCGGYLPYRIDLYGEYSNGDVACTPTLTMRLTKPFVDELDITGEEDLSDFVRVFGDRLEGNFWQLYRELTP